MKEMKFDGNKLFNLRKQKNMSQEKLADIVGVTRQTIYLWESNQTLPDIEKVMKICDALEIDLNELVDVPLKFKDSKTKRNGKILLRVLIITILLIIIIYFIISNVKFIRLNKILNKWEDLNKLDSYYISINEFDTDNNGTITQTNENYEKYLKDDVITTVFKDLETGEISFIMIDNYKTKERIITNETDKTYTKEKLKSKSTGLIDNLPDTLKFNDNMLINYFACFNPNFKVRKDSLIVDSSQIIVNKDTGLVTYEEYLDKDSKTQNFIRIYKIETNTKKDFSVDLSKYTENY